MGLFLRAVLFTFFLDVADTFLFERNRKVDCLVTHWSQWSSPNKDGQIVRTSKILRMPQNGGENCPRLREVKDEGCNCTSWSKWSHIFGFGQKSRTRHWLKDQSIILHGFREPFCHETLEEDIRYTGQKPTLIETTSLIMDMLNPNRLVNMDSYYTTTIVPSNLIGKVRDIVLILDSSGSISRVNFDKAKKDAKSLFGLICPENTTFDANSNDLYQHHQLALLTYSTSVQEIFNFNTYNKTANVLNAITDAEYIGHMTNTAGAFRKAKEMFQLSRGARESYDKVKREVLILTDGLSNTGGDAVKASDDLSEVADVYGLMIGKFSPAGKEELTKYVSKPASRHLFSLENFDKFSELVDAAKKFKKDNPCVPLY